MEESKALPGVLIVRQLYRGKVTAGFRFEVKSGEELLVGLELAPNREPQRMLVGAGGVEPKVFEPLSRSEKDQAEVFVRRVKEFCKSGRLERLAEERRLELKDDQLSELTLIVKMTLRKRG